MNTIQEHIELLAARNEQIRELQERISGLENELSKREIELSNLKRLHFGQSSEKMKKPNRWNQCRCSPNTTKPLSRP